MRSLKLLLSVVLAAALLFAGADVAAQTPPVADSPAHRAAERLFATLRQDPAAREAFVASEFSARALQQEAVEQRTALLDRLAAQSGGLTVVETLPQKTPTFVELIVRTDKGHHFGKVVLGLTRAEPHKISTLFILPTRDPAKARASAFPAGKVSAARLPAELRGRVKALASEDLFSGVVLVARRDRILYLEAYQQADKAFGAPNTAATRFNIGSMGKMFTGVAVAQLVEQGKLSLDATVGELLPDFQAPEAARKITVEQLLTHTSGLGDFFGPPYFSDRTSYLSDASYLPLIAAQPPAFEPGSRFAYSNNGYALLGAIIAKVTGRDFASYLEGQVFAPSGMTATGYPSLSDVVRNRAVGYRRAAGDSLGMEPRIANWFSVAYKGNAAGGAYSTATDLFAFSRALLSNRLLSPEMTRRVLEPRHEFVGTSRPSRYGYGFLSERCGEREVIGHGGGGPDSGVSSVLFATPDGEWTVIVLSNYDPPVAEDLAVSLCEFVARQ